MNTQEKYTPIALFVYNRPFHTLQTVEALEKNQEAKNSLLYIFADGPKDNANDEVKQKIKEVRTYIRTISGFKDIIIEEADKNKGLANSIISGVTKVIEKHSKVIVVEDDLITHKFFLRFMNDALSFYNNEEQIFCIGAITKRITIPSSYKNDVLVVPRIESCGWGTWKDRWLSAQWDISKYHIFEKNNKKDIKQFCRGGEDLWPMLQMQLEGKVDSWAVRWQYNMSIQNKLCLLPVYSLLTNIGMDGTGIHSPNSGVLPTTPMYNKDYYDFEFVHNVKENKTIVSNFRRFYALPRNSKFKQYVTIIRSKLSIIKHNLCRKL